MQATMQVVAGLENTVKRMAEDQKEQKQLTDARFQLMTEQITAAVKGLSNDVKGLETRLTGQMVTLETRMDGRMTKLEDKMVTLETRVSDKISSLDGKVTALDTKVTALDGKVTALDNKVTALDTKVTALDGKVTELDIKVTALDGKVSDKTKNLEKRVGYKMFAVRTSMTARLNRTMLENRLLVALLVTVQVVFGGDSIRQVLLQLVGKSME